MFHETVEAEIKQQPSVRDGSRKPGLIALFLVLLTLAAYWPAAHGPFFSDDVLYVAGNKQLQSVPLRQAWKLFITRTNPYEFLPVRDLSYRIDFALFGLNPFGYHLHNLILYGLCCLAVWLCCSTLLQILSQRHHLPREAGEQSWICAAVTILFVTHPVHVESVAWISGRKDLLSGLFVFLSIWQFTLSLLSATLLSRNLFFSIIFFVLALMSKLTVLPLAALLLLLAAARWKDSTRNSYRKVVIMVLPAALMAGIWFAIATSVGKETGIKADPFTTEVRQQVSFPELQFLILGYLTKIALWPTKLRLIYDLMQPAWLSAAFKVLGAAVFGIGIWGAYQLWFKKSALGFAVIFFLIFCLPFLQLVPFSTWSFVSERFLFLPVFGLAMAIAVLLRYFEIKWQKFVLFFLAFLGIFATYRQAGKWSSPDRLLEETAMRSPQAYIAQSYYIQYVLLPQGRFQEAEKAANGLRSALAAQTLMRYCKAWKAIHEGNLSRASQEAGALAYVIEPQSEPSFSFLLGMLAEQQGKYFEAARYFYYTEQSAKTEQEMMTARKLLERIRSRYDHQRRQLQNELVAESGNISVEGELANLEMELFFLDDAATRYQIILQRHPELAGAHYNLGLTYLRMGQYARAIPELRKAIDNGISSATAWNNMAISYKKVGEIELAEDAFRQALRINPSDCYARINLGRLYMALEDWEQARSSFQRLSQSNCGSDLQEVVQLYLRDVERTIKP